MSTVELKSKVIKLVEDIQNEELLETLFEFLSNRKKATAGAMWDDLTADQKQEVLDSFEESEHEDELVEKDKLFRHIK